jgi:ABC-2 type transport system ATP-binding protein
MADVRARGRRYRGDVMELTTSERIAPPGAVGAPSIEVVGLWRRFREVEALRDVSLEVEPGEIRALLGPNGAGKTTLLRVLTGLLLPDRGDVGVLGVPAEAMTTRSFRRLFGFVPSGDRSFYLRLTGLENLSFFARMYGMSKRRAAQRSMEVLELVGLTDAARRPVGLFSHGMQKRLSMARGMLTDPRVLFVDEATHDLDPEAAMRIRGLVTDAAARGVAVVWTTQRVEEIRGFADRVTLLHRGEVRFDGSVPQLIAAVPSSSFLLHLRAPSGDVETLARAALVGAGDVRPSGDAEHLALVLADGVTLGRAISMLDAAGLDVLACREERSGVEEAFLFLTGDVA